MDRSSVVFSVINYITIEILDAVLSGHVSMTALLSEIEMALVDLKQIVREAMKGRRGGNKNAPMEPGGPSWDDPAFLSMTLEEVRRLAQKNVPGYKTAWKLLTSGRDKFIKR